MDPAAPSRTRAGARLAALARRARRPDGGTAGYGLGAAILSAGLGASGVLTFLYFALASHALDGPAYKRITLLWSVMTIVLATIYRPVEQLLSRTIAGRRAAGGAAADAATPRTGTAAAPLGLAAALQAAFASLVLAAALVFRGPIQDDVFDGSAALFWALLVGIAGYAGSYLARGWLAGHRRFELYGALTVLEGGARLVVALAVTAGLLAGESVLAFGMTVGALVGLVVVPVALARGRRRGADVAEAAAPAPAHAASRAPARPPAPAAPARTAPLSPAAAQGASFALSAFAIMLAEQTFLNAAVLIADATSSDAALGGYVFNVLLISRAPLLLFQAVQTSLLPHLSGLDAIGERVAFTRALRVTVAAIVAFTTLVALALLAVGPLAMRIVFGHGIDYARGGLALIGLGVGLHLIATTLSQAALARGRAAATGAAWLVCGALFAAWNAAAPVADRILRVETGYLGAALVLVLALTALNRRYS